MKKQMLFKYKSITTIEQLKWFIDSIKNNYIYFPDYKQLNDPLESSGYVIELTGYSGKNMMLALDVEDNIVAQKRQEYRILSLTDNCFSPSMWAHYTNGYNGVCIGYWKDESFLSARKITYINKSIMANSTGELGCIDYSKLDDEVYESFFYKHSDWTYENEWRIIAKQKQQYYEYTSDALACIIIGDKLDRKIMNAILNSISVPIYVSKTGYRSFGVNLLPYSYRIEMDGANPPYIRTIEELIEDIIKKHNKSLLY